MEATARPSLHEIANMPHSMAQAAIRKHYDPHWGEPCLDEGEGNLWDIAIHFTYVTTTDDVERVQIRATSEAEAEAKARAYFREKVATDYDEADIETIDVREVATQ